MAELKGKKRMQPSSCPEGWGPAAMALQLELTRRQERYAQRCVGIARFIYNRMVANDQAGRDVRSLAHAPRTGEGVQRRKTGQLQLWASYNPSQQVRGPGRVP